MRAWSANGRPAGAAALAACGAALLLGAWRADAGWFERHVILPFYFLRPAHLPAAVRAAGALGGAALLAAAWGLGRARRAPEQQATNARLAEPAPWPARWPSILAALAASLLAAELVLRTFNVSAGGPAWRGYELKVGQPDPRYGWAAVPGHTTTITVAGTTYQYAVNALGARAGRSDERPDLASPTLLVTGESIASGYGLDWSDTFAARCGRALGLQVIDVAEGGYGFDQAYLRAADLLPRLARPVAVVTVFVPAQLGRSLRSDRPRLVLEDHAGLVFRPPADELLSRLRLVALFRHRLPIATTAEVEGAEALGRAVFVATAAAARARGAVPLFVVPAAHGAPEREALNRALFEAPGLPYVTVDLQPDDVIPGDGHPNAHGARKLADAITAALRARIAARADADVANDQRR
jgi:hypothetical protein